MKKLIVGLVAAVMVAAGLVASTGVSTATAAPYPGSVGTGTSAVGIAAPPHTARVYIRVTSKVADEPGRPQGRLNVVFVSEETGKTYDFTRRYSGRAKTYTFANLKRGKYTVLVTFVPPSESKWKPSNARTRATVTGRR